jgi:hypothetical protein
MLFSKYLQKMKIKKSIFLHSSATMTFFYKFLQLFGKKYGMQGFRAVIHNYGSGSQFNFGSSGSRLRNTDKMSYSFRN